MKNSLLILFAMVISFSLIDSHAASANVKAEELATYKELMQSKLDATKESLSKDQQAMQAKLDAQDKIISIQNDRFADWKQALAVFGVIATLLGYLTVTKRAEKEAQKVATKWLKDNADAITKRALGDFEGKIAKLVRQAGAQIDQAVADTRKKLADANNAIADLQAEITDSARKQKQQPEPETETETEPKSLKADSLEQLVDQIKNKPENAYTFEDWNARAFSDYRERKYSIASEYWLRAANASGATVFLVAQSLLNAAMSFREDKKYENSLRVLETLLEKFGGEREGQLFALTRMAMSEKGYVQAQMKRFQASIETYKKLVELLDQPDTRASLLEIAYAYTGLAIQYTNIADPEESIRICQDILTRFGASQDNGIQILMGQVNNGLGFANLLLAKKHWENANERNRLLQQSLQYLQTALQSGGSDELKFHVLGNFGYTYYLLNDIATAEQQMKLALKDGGEYLYEAELDDAEILRLPIDDEFIAWIKKLWAEIKAV